MSKEEAEEIARGEKTEGEVLLLLLSFRGRRDEAEQQEALVVAVAPLNISSSSSFFPQNKNKALFGGKSLSKKSRGQKMTKTLNYILEKKWGETGKSERIPKRD